MESAVLFVSPHVQDAWALTRMLGDVSVTLVHASSLKEAVIQMESHRLLAVLTEATLEDGTWRDLLALTRHKKIELVVTDPFADSRFWAEAINLGAYDVLAQPFHGTEVQRVLASAASRRTEVRAAAGL
jgi:DNA-binding NtrC family response regulator